MNIFKRIFRNGNGRIVSQQGLIMPENEFRAIMLHECARCDRNGSHFSLIQIDPKALGGAGEEKRLLRRIIKRIRITDEVGLLSNSTIGVFLPETGRDGAAAFARDVIGSHGYQIFHYPYNFKAPQRPDRGGNGRGRKRLDHAEASFDHSAGMVPNASLTLKSGIAGGIADMAWSGTADGGNGTGNSGHSHGNIRELLQPAGLPIWKRAVDIAGASIVLLLMSPVLLAVAAFIKVVSPGPVFFIQQRIGYLGRPFPMFKFRSMKVSADQDVHKDHLKKIIKGDGRLQKLDNGNDDRFIPLAGLLRKSCIDELPQLINVLRGEMSLVGPRPCLDYEAEEFDSWQCGRFDTFPGMTGLWQVSGKSRTTFTEMMRLDVRYSRRRTVGMDVGICIGTPRAIFREAMDVVRARRASAPAAGEIRPVRVLNSLVRQLFL